MYQNKYFRILCLCFTVLAFSGCKKDKGILSFDMIYDDFLEFKPEPGVSAYPYVIFQSPEVQSNAESEFTKNNTSADRVKSIKLTQMDLKLEAPLGQRFNFLGWIKISITAGTLPIREVANLYNIDTATVGNVIHLNIIDQDLQEYLKQPSFQMTGRLKAVSDPDPNQTMTLKHEIKFNVIADR